MTTDFHRYQKNQLLVQTDDLTTRKNTDDAIKPKPAESKFLSLFEGYGIELEYMIVDPDSLNIRPISDRILQNAAGKICGDFVDGEITWSNELVLHVIELKTSGPSSSLENLDEAFSRSLKNLHSYARKHGARLMPTAMHPLMEPSNIHLWPHDNNEVYACYDRIFNCRGHGWNNLQSMHINLPFRTDQDFALLHAAIRFILPILPALSASSPLVEGRMMPAHDNRLIHYQKNQAQIPSIAGWVIPEPISSISEYKEKILKKIFADIAPHDPDELLRDDWLNSRGAIARFERQSIEIRVLDLQETHRADLAIADFVVATLKYLIYHAPKIITQSHQLSTEKLKEIFDRTILEGESASLETAPGYLYAWGAPSSIKNTSELWKWLLNQPLIASEISKTHLPIIELILSQGTLATRIRKSLGAQPSTSEITNVYKALCDCLIDERSFLP